MTLEREVQIHQIQFFWGHPNQSMHQLNFTGWKNNTFPQEHLPCPHGIKVQRIQHKPTNNNTAEKVSKNKSVTAIISKHMEILKSTRLMQAALFTRAARYICNSTPCIDNQRKFLRRRPNKKPGRVVPAEMKRD